MKFRADCSVDNKENILVDFHKEKRTLLIGINTKTGTFPHIVLSKEDVIALSTLLNQALQGDY